LAALERESRQAERDEQIRRVAQIERQLVTAHEEPFVPARKSLVGAPKVIEAKAINDRVRVELGIPDLVAELAPFGQPPQALGPQPVDLEALIAEEEKLALNDISLFRRGDRRQARTTARAAAEKHAEQMRAERAESVAAEQRRLDGVWEDLQYRQARASLAATLEHERLAAEAKAERGRQQAEIDAVWQQLMSNDPAVVIDALETAFADNNAPATPIDCVAASGTATVTMLFGHPDLVPERTPAFTSSGRPTLRKRSKSDRNDLYVNALASNVLATVKEGFAVAPGLTAMKILVVRRDPFQTGGDQLVAVYAGMFSRQMVASVKWQNIKPANLLDAPDDWLLNLKGQADEVVPLDLGDEPDLQTILEHLADILAIPPLRPKRSRSSTGPRGSKAKTAERPSSSPPRHASSTQRGADIGRMDVFAFIDLGDHLDPTMLSMIEQRLQDPDPTIRQRALDYRAQLTGG
jgi:hypothetical protein